MTKKDLLHAVPAGRRQQSAATDHPVTEIPSAVELDDIIGVLQTKVASLTELLNQKDLQLRAARTQLAQVGKLATLGTLGAGVAHELNNPLTVISAEADELLDGIKQGFRDDDFTVMSASNIKKCAERMRLIIDHIRQYTRKDEEPTGTRLDVNSIVKDSLMLLENQLRNSGISIKLALAEHLPAIWGHANKLESVFQNLISNARDAFDETDKNQRKELTIQTSLVNQEIVVKVSDNGCGIPDEVQAHIFDPFFTTKEVGRGTGLGMSIARSNVEEHKGTISLESSPESGTEFVIRLPLERRNLRNN